MRRASGRAAIMALEIFAVIALLFGLGVAGIAWRLSRGPVDLSSYAPQLEATLASAFGGRRVKAARLALAWSSERRRFEINARDVRVLGRDSTPLTRFDEIGIGLRAAPLLIGRISAAQVFARGGQVSIVRWPDGRLSAGLGPPEAVAPPRERKTAGTWHAETVKAFQRIDQALREAGGTSFTAENVALGYRDLTGTAPRDEALTGVALTITQPGGGTELQLGVPTGGGRLRLLANYQRNGGVKIGARAEGIAAEALVPETIADDLGFLDGNVDVAIDGARGLDAAGLDLRLLAERMTDAARLAESPAAGPAGPKPPELKGSEIRGSWSANADRFTFDRLKLGASGSLLEGQLTIDGLARTLSAPAKEKIGFNLDLRAPRLNLGNQFSSPLGAKSLKISGEFDPAMRSFAIAAAEMKVSAGTALGNGKIGLATTKDGATTIVLKARAQSAGVLSIPEMLSFWPVNLGRGAREWVAENLKAGRIFDVTGNFDLPADRPFPDRWPDEAIDVRFSFDQGVTIIRPESPPLIEAAGKVHLRGNSFFLDLASGSLSGLRADKARVEIPHFKPEGGLTIVTGTLSGQLSDLMAGLASSDPRVAQSLPAPASAFTGAGTVDFEIRRPSRNEVPLEEYFIAVTGNFPKARITEAVYGLKLGEGELRFSADNRKVGITADFRSPDAPVSVSAELPYEETARSLVKAEGRVTPAAIAAFGVPIRAAFSGVADLRADFRGPGFGVNEGVVRLDLAAARVDLPGIWVKRAQQPAQLALDLVRRPSGAFDLRGFTASGPGLDARGAAAFGADGRLESADLATLKLGDAVDVAGRIGRSADGRTLNMEFSGGRLDITPLVRGFIENLQTGPAPSPPPASPQAAARPAVLSAHGQLGVLVIDKDLTLKDVSLALQTEDGQLLSAELSGKTPEAKPMRIAITPGKAAPGAPAAASSVRDVAIEVADAGAASAPFLPDGVIKGGSGRIEGVWNLDPTKTSKLSLVVDDVRLAKAPALAQVLSLASLTGLADTLSGEGVGFKQISGIFSIKDGRVFIENGRAAGAAMGFTLRGLVDFSKNTLDLEGVLVPSYGLNSLIGNAPGVGKVLTSRKGEGVFGMNYRIRGPFEKARASINPLSVLTPGILRRIFQPGKKTPKEFLEEGPAE